MGALDCVPNGRMQSTDSTEVFAISMASNSTLNEPRRDLESQGTVGQSRRQKLLYTFLVDIPLVLLVLVLIGLFELGYLPVHQAGFYCGDPALSHPYRGDTVTTSMLMSILFLAPLVIIFITEFIFADTGFESTRLVTTWKQTLFIYKSYIYGLIFNLAIVEVMKGVTGSPRPTFFDICEPDTGVPDETCIRSEFVTSYKCTSTKFSWWMKKDASMSFPSGHTSMSVHCGVFLAWYLQKRAFDWRFRTIFLVPVIQMACITFAAISSLTRITDHRHHWWDVLAGLVIGIFSFIYAAIVLCNNFSTLKPKKNER